MMHQPSSPAVSVTVNGEPWTEVESLANAAASDAVFALDRDTGTVTFGDGVHGKLPPQGSELTISYRIGAGSAGNVSAASITTLWPPVPAHLTLTLTPGSVQLSGPAHVQDIYSGAKRNAYFFGLVLSAHDFHDEQNYLIGKRRLHNRALHGIGVVNGLQVSVDSGGSATAFVVQPGLALDGYGREILLTSPVRVVIETELSALYLILEYVEREADPVPSPNGGLSATRIEEGARLFLAATGTCGLAIARLLRDIAGWKVDASFVPPRPR